MNILIIEDIITTNSMKIERITKDYEQLFDLSFDTLNAKAQYLQRHKLQKPTKQEIDNLNRSKII